MRSERLLVGAWCLALSLSCTDGEPRCRGAAAACGASCHGLSSVNSNCGGCGTVCAPGTVCTNGRCVAVCGPPRLLCDAVCVDPGTSREHCGASGDCVGERAGQRCNDPEVCSSGVCSLPCPEGLVACSGGCVDPQTSREFCGASDDCSGQKAGTSCRAGEDCVRGVCTSRCTDGLVACAGGCVDPLTHPEFCGAFGSCSGLEAGQRCSKGEVCAAGMCLVPCPAGLLNCDGACINPTTDRLHCGAGASCAGAQRGASCRSDEECAQGTCRAAALGNVLLRVAFDAPGCHPSGSGLGAGGEAIVIRRPVSKLCPLTTGDLTCAANSICVTDKACGAGFTGLLIEPGEVVQTATTGPLAGKTIDWCIGMTATPIGADWSVAGSLFKIGSSTPYAEHYTTGGHARFVAAGAGGVRQSDLSSDLSPGSHRLRFCSKSSGRIAIQIDGIELPRQVISGGTGSGLTEALPPWMYIGSRGAESTALGGCISNFEVTDSVGLPDWTPVRALWIGDSIYFNRSLWAAAEVHASRGAVFPIVDDTATFNGHNTGLALLELADETWAFEAGAWTLRDRGVPFSSFGALIMSFGANDAGQLSTAEYRRAYDKALHQARKAGFGRVCAGGPPPRATAGLLDWDASGFEASYYPELKSVWSKWDVSFTDMLARFRALTRKGMRTVSDLMSDSVHPGAGGVEIEGEVIGGCLNLAGRPSPTANPEIPGRIVNELFGEPVSGSWTISDLVTPSQPIGQAHRIAGYPASAEKALVSSDSGAILRFRPHEASAIWIRFFIEANGGSLVWYIDRGSANERSGYFSTGWGGTYTLTGQTRLLADGLGPGPHEVELRTGAASTAPVRVMGVTFVGVP